MTAVPAFIGRYAVRDEIGRGGFALVVEAWDEELASRVAIKILHAELAADDDFVARFLHEARLLRRIRSPQVVTVHDVGRLDDGRPYFVLDHADRGSLAARLQDGTAYPGRQLTPLADALADGLRAVHQAGLVHRDIKPGNILFRRSRRLTHAAPSVPALVADDEQVLIGDLGIARDLLQDGDRPTAAGGTPLYLAPEQLDGSAPVAPAADIYAASALLWQILSGRPPPPPGRIEQHLGTLPPAWQPVLLRGMAVDPRRRHPDMDAWLTAVHQALEDAPTDAAPAAAARPGRCPYKGLAAYQAADAEFFCGREHLVDELLKRLQLHRVLVVGGPSGSGKSSLVRAGLLPALAADTLPGSAAWQVEVMTPGSEPLQEFCNRFDLSFARRARLMDALAGTGTHEEIDRLLRETGLTAPGDRLLVVDQFEELFTLADPSQGAAFLALLQALVQPADAGMRIVLAVRADFYDLCAATPWLAECITANQVLVGPMSRTELRRAVVEPAQRAGLYLEEGLVDALLEDSGNEAGTLPLLAHALVETWVQRQGNTLTLADYRACGGVAGAIAQTAEALYRHRFDAAQQRLARQLFLRLVSSNEDAPETRRILRRSALMLEEEAEALATVIEQLTQARLLTLNEDRIQIAHEALLQTWPRLRDWIEQSRDDLRMRQRIALAAAEWAGAGRDPDLLYRGTPLLAALEWRATRRDLLGPAEHAFLDAARAERDRLQALADERRRRNRRWRRLAGAALALLAVGASFSALLAYRAAQEATANARRAAAATEEAHRRFAAALGSAAFGLAGEDPRLALALATESLARSPARNSPYDARAAIARARRALADGGLSLLGSPIPAGEALGIALAPDGRRLAIAQADGEIHLYDVPGRRLLQRLQGHRGGVRAVAFAPDGRLLASSGVDGTLRLWRMSAEGSGGGRILGRTDDILPDLAFDPEGRRIATAGMDGTVRLWRIADGSDRVLARLPVEFNTVAFAPDGRAVLASSNDARIHAWSAADGRPLFPARRLEGAGHFLSLRFNRRGDRMAAVNTDQVVYLLAWPSGRLLPSPFPADVPISAAAYASADDRLLAGDTRGRLRLADAGGIHTAPGPAGHGQAVIALAGDRSGHRVATLGADQTVRLWAVADAPPLSRDYRAEGTRLRAVAFSPDGRWLAGGGTDGLLRLWRRGSDRPPRALPGHEAGIWALAFSPSGRRLASADRAGRIRLRDPDGKGADLALEAGEAVWSLIFLDERRLLAAADGGLHLWRLNDPEHGHRFLKHADGRLTRMALSPDGRLLATASSDGRVALRDPATLDLHRRFEAARDTLWSLAFSPGGERLATAAADGSVSVWEITEGRRLARLSGHAGGATDVTFLADGSSLVSLDRRGRLHWWDQGSRRKLTAPLQAHHGAVWRLALAPDGQTLATAGDDGLAREWDLFDPRRACELGRAAFDPVRRRQYLGTEAPRASCIQRQQ